MKLSNKYTTYTTPHKDYFDELAVEMVSNPECLYDGTRNLVEFISTNVSAESDGAFVVMLSIIDYDRITYSELIDVLKRCNKNQFQDVFNEALPEIKNGMYTDNVYEFVYPLYGVMVDYAIKIDTSILTKLPEMIPFSRTVHIENLKGRLSELKPVSFSSIGITNSKVIRYLLNCSGTGFDDWNKEDRQRYFQFTGLTEIDLILYSELDIIKQFITWLSK